MIKRRHVDQAQVFFTSWIELWENNFVYDLMELYNKKTDNDKETIQTISALNIHGAATRYFNKLKEVSLKEDDVLSWDLKEHLIKEFNKQTTYFCNIKTDTGEIEPSVRVRYSEFDIGDVEISASRTINGNTIQIFAKDTSSTFISLKSLKDIISNDGLVINNTDIYLPYVLGRCYFLRFLHAKLSKLLSSQDYDESTSSKEVIKMLKSYKGSATGKYIFATLDNVNEDTFKEYEDLTKHSYQSIRGGYFRAKEHHNNNSFSNEVRENFWIILFQLIPENKFKELTTR